MELVHAHQVTFDELLNETIDVFIAACGAQTRCKHIISQSHFNARRKIALLFNLDLQNESVAQNEIFFKQNGFECYTIDNNSGSEILTVLNSVCNTVNHDAIKLLVDYSSMSKVWYATIINYFAFNDLEYSNLIVYFCYTPEKEIVNESLKALLPAPEPIFFKRPTINNTKPVALIMGLSPQKFNLNFILDFFKPNNVYYFVPNPSFDENAAEITNTSYKEILQDVNATNVFKFPSWNIEDIDSKLTSLCLNLRLNYRIVLISMGPQTFSLASFLLNARYPDIEIWNVCQNNHSIDLIPNGVPIVYKAILSGEEN